MEYTDIVIKVVLVYMFVSMWYSLKRAEKIFYLYIEEKEKTDRDLVGPTQRFLPFGAR